MKRAQTISVLALLLSLAVMAVNWFAVHLPDWAVRSAGVVMLAALAGAAYCFVRGRMER